MKLLVLYRPDSEHARATEVFLHDLSRQHDIDPGDIRTVSVDSREGVALAQLYGIMAYPGIIITEDNGAYVKHWSGDFPLMEELMSYLYTH